MIVSTIDVKAGEVPLVNPSDHDCLDLLAEKVALEFARLARTPNPIERDHFRQIARKLATRRGVLFLTLHIEERDGSLENGRKG